MTKRKPRYGHSQHCCLHYRDVADIGGSEEEHICLYYDTSDDEAPRRRAKSAMPLRSAVSTRNKQNHNQCGCSSPCSRLEKRHNVRDLSKKREPRNRLRQPMPRLKRKLQRDSSSSSSDSSTEWDQIGGIPNTRRPQPKRPSGPDRGTQPMEGRRVTRKRVRFSKKATVINSAEHLCSCDKCKKHNSRKVKTLGPSRMCAKCQMNTSRSSSSE